jgi:hypothetical protein
MAAAAVLRGKVGGAPIPNLDDTAYQALCGYYGACADSAANYADTVMARAKQWQSAGALAATQEMTLQTTTGITPSVDLGQAILAYAVQFKGLPYIYGGENPNSGFDCSGLVQYVYKHFGIDLPRVTDQQVTVGTQFHDPSQLQVGDLIFSNWAGDAVYPGHVAIYAGKDQYGNPQTFEASSTGTPLHYVPLDAGYMSHVVAFARVTQLAPASETLTLNLPTAGAISAPAWWNGQNCDAGTDSASHPLGAEWNGLVACGPRPAHDGFNDVTAHFFAGSYGVYEWECVELSLRWLYLAYGVPPYAANGGTIWSNYSPSMGGGLQQIANGSGVAPVPGDVVSWPGFNNGPGHTAVVTDATVDGSGNGSIKVMEENGTIDGWDTYPVTNWVVGGGAYLPNAAGWLHKPSSGSKTQIVGL